MAQHNEVGQKGEQAARNYLVKKGYHIVAFNWHFGKKEIDIVANHNQTMIFIEVKTRSTLTFELPKEAVTPKKMRNLIEAADAFLIQRHIDLPSRFDIVTVLMNPTPTILEHIEGAFLPNELI
jgi:putative endonuclease